ncbi:hypothetical protein [Pedobacter frigidisoli]|uniref:hypothetical protein n=1 Tax=Pedobacter frigidisoli TaxID=2530455 RepID=UPI00292D5F2E|nr:hypothetical protein [Pedobacter frigidisoli]
MNQFKALYGVFNIDMNPVTATDITEILKERFLKGDSVVIPAGLSFNDAFTDPAFGQPKFLQIEHRGRKHDIIEADYDYDIEISLSETVKKIRIIYYVYINRNSNWRGIVSGQLLQIKGYGLLDEAALYIHITDTDGKADEVIRFIGEFVSDAIISTNNENLFEYPAISLVYNLAKQFPDDIFIYFHSKAMSYNVTTRRIDEVALLTKTFENWRKKLELFKNPQINKAGLFPAIGSNDDKEIFGVRGGWIWYNFWYARGSYIVNCDEPLITHDRYFFEHWLGLQNGTLTIGNDCANLYTAPKNNKIYFTPAQAHVALTELINREMTRF